MLGQNLCDMLGIKSHWIDDYNVIGYMNDAYKKDKN